MVCIFLPVLTKYPQQLLPPFHTNHFPWEAVGIEGHAILLRHNLPACLFCMYLIEWNVIQTSDK